MTPQPDHHHAFVDIGSLDHPNPAYLVCTGCGLKYLPEKPPPSLATPLDGRILEHLLAVWPDGKRQAWSADLAVRLTEAYPAEYPYWTAESVTFAVRPFGMRSKQMSAKVDGPWRTRRGVTLASLEAAQVALHPGQRPQRHALYRWYGADDRLLYVGITADLGQRTKAHSKGKPWWADVVRNTVEHYDNREDALAAETAAIVAEHPLHNVTHNATRDIDGRVLDDLKAVWPGRDATG